MFYVFHFLSPLSLPSGFGIRRRSGEFLFVLCLLSVSAASELGRNHRNLLPFCPPVLPFGFSSSHKFETFFCPSCVLQFPLAAFLASVSGGDQNLFLFIIYAFMVSTSSTSANQRTNTYIIALSALPFYIPFAAPTEPGFASRTDVCLLALSFCFVFAAIARVCGFVLPRASCTGVAESLQLVMCLCLCLRLACVYRPKVYAHDRSVMGMSDCADFVLDSLALCVLMLWLAGDGRVCLRTEREGEREGGGELEGEGGEKES